MTKMTKKEALDFFKETHADFLKENYGDTIAKNTAWADFTDMLMKDGQITNYQYENWVPPF